MSNTSTTDSEEQRSLAMALISWLNDRNGVGQYTPSPCTPTLLEGLDVCGLILERRAAASGETPTEPNEKREVT